MHQLTHSEIKPFNCLICKISFVTRDKLKNHQAVHAKNKLKTDNFVCDRTKCSFEAILFVTLLEHIKELHKNFRYNCERCEFESKTKQQLNGHVEGDHENVRYSCEKCKFYTKRRKNASKHNKIKHQGYNLSACNVAFNLRKENC